MTFLQLPQCLLTFAVLVAGLGLPAVVGLPLRAAEKICLAPAVALIVIYLGAFAIYAFDLSYWCFLVLPATAIVGLLWRRRAVGDLLGDDEVKRLLRAYAIWTGWVLGLLALVRCYFGVGAGATGDWVEHYQRALFFLGHWPLDYRFIWLYSLPARPPLANLATGAFLALSHRDFAAFQVFASLESTLVFLPGWLMYRRFAGRRGGRAFLLVCMANPLLLHNATYPWTKLITAYFVLAGLHLFLEGMEWRRSGYFVACFLLLSAGLLAHYSAGPYGLVLGVSYLLIHRKVWFRRSFLARTGVLVLVSSLLLATWFGWSSRHYGLRTTVASNTSVAATETGSWRTQAEERLGNLASSLVPLPLREPGYAPEEMHSPVVTLDQYGYMFYQLTLPFAFGVTGAVFLGWLLVRRLRRPGPAQKGAAPYLWAVFVGATILVGILVNGRYDKYGLAHICLQPLVVLGLAFLAAELPSVSPRLRAVFWAGLALDGLMGVGLHFFVEHGGAALLRPVNPLSPAFLSHGALPASWTVIWLSNLLMKFYFGLSFIGDHAPPVWILLAFLACLLALALRQPAVKTNPPSMTGERAA